MDSFIEINNAEQALEDGAETKVLTPEEEAKLLNRREAFRADTGTTANCRITVIAAEGIKPGVHASVAQNILTLDDLLDS